MINYINIVCDYIVTIVFYILDTSIICIGITPSYLYKIHTALPRQFLKFQ